MKKIVFTGGGSAGHVTPNIALFPYFRENGYEIHYIGSEEGIEKTIIEKEKDIIYHHIRAGKLRRYFSLKNFTDIFKVIGGYYDSKKLLKEIKPDIVFSKGGFVCVPVCAACGRLKIPVVSHESDITPGLANRISKKFADKVCLTFKETLKYVKPPKGIYTGTPIRGFLYYGSKQDALDFLQYGDPSKPVLLIIGGSLGSKTINNAVRENIRSLTDKFNIIHFCGKNNIWQEVPEDCAPSYRQYEFFTEGLQNMFALADIIMSRAGSNSIHEFLALKKPMLLIPLSGKASRGDQILNSENFKARGLCDILREEEITPELMLSKINEVYDRRDEYIKAETEAENADGTSKIIDVILETAKKAENSGKKLKNA